MNDATHNPLEEGLVYEAHLPLRWRVLAETEEGVAEQLDEPNLRFLRTLAALGEHLVEGYDEEAPGLGQEMVRIDAKLNLILDLLQRYIVRYEAFPPMLPVRLGAAGMEWTDPQPPAADSLVLVELFPEPGVPRPLELPARVLALEPAAGGSLARVAFTGLSEALQEGLQKFVFRQHRRSIARRRHGGG